MEDGRMMLGAVHQDYIHTTSDYPDADIGYPNNPDLGTVQCLLDITTDTQTQTCVPISGQNLPHTKLTWPNNTTTDSTRRYPQPTSGTSMETPKVITSQCSQHGVNWLLELPPVLWFSCSQTLANENGKATVALVMMFNTSLLGITRICKSSLHKLGRMTILGIVTRISYWYEESGQRAIPLTYGSYPANKNVAPNIPSLSSSFEEGRSHLWNWW